MPPTLASVRGVPETPEQFHARAKGALRMSPIEDWETFPFEGDIRPRALEPQADHEKPRRGEGGIEAAELGPLLQRIERAVRAAGDISRVHIGRWGEGSEHLHWWFMGRPARMRQLSDSFAAIWDDILPPVPDDVWRASVAKVVAALG